MVGSDFVLAGAPKMLKSFVTGMCGLALALLLFGCESSRPTTEPCVFCNGTGRTSRGPCTSCEGRGYRAVSQYEMDRRRAAEENQKRIARGEQPLPPAESRSWWDRHGWKPILAFAGVAVIWWFRRSPGRAANQRASDGSVPASPTNERGSENSSESGSARAG